MNCPNIRFSFTQPLVLPPITEDQQLINSNRKIKFTREQAQSVSSPCKKFRETANNNIFEMSPENLKISVQNNPFMQAKLKCLIKFTQKSLNKENWIRSPTHKSDYSSQPNRLQTVYSMKKERKDQQKEKISKLVELLKENDQKYPQSPRMTMKEPFSN